VIDAWASVIIGVIMASIAVVLLKETRSLVIGEGITADEVKDVVFIVESDPAVIKCGRVLSLYLGPDDLLMNLDVTFRDDLVEGGVLMAIDRIEEEIMREYPQTTRIFIEAESLNQVYRQRRDRMLQFADYEEEKNRDERLGERMRERRERNEELFRQARERRELRREELARSYNRTYFPDLAAAEGGEGAAAEAIATTMAATGVLADGAARKKLFSEIPNIQGERIVLNRMVDTDAAALRDLIDNPRVQRYVPAYLFEKQRSDEHETIAELYGDLFKNKESLFLAIRLKDTGEMVGIAEFYGLRDRLHKISIGYRLRESWWGKGIATEAARLMVGYLYGETDIQIITASTMVENEASAHVLENADFIRTARYVEEDWGFPEPVIVDKWFC